MSDVKFSVIVPVYNVEKFLRECLDSITSQTLKNFEVICIDDGSTDNSLEILQEYANKDSRFKVISQENQGQGIVRNRAIDMAQGEYLFFIDPDDFIESETLATIYDKFCQTDAEIVQFDFETCEENGEHRGFVSYKELLEKNTGFSLKDNQIFNWNEIKNKKLLGMSFYVWDKAYKTDFIKQHNIKCAPSKRGEDNIFSYSANLLADKILYVSKTFYHYRIRLASATQKVSNDNFCVFDNIALLKNFLITNNLFNEYKEGFEEYALDVLDCHFFKIPTESVEKYLDKCKDILSPENYELFSKKIKGDFSFSIWEEIFSTKNRYIGGEKIKCITILGFTFLLTPMKKSLKQYFCSRDRKF